MNKKKNMPAKRGSLRTLLTRETPFPNEEGELPNGVFEVLDDNRDETNGSPNNSLGALSTARVLVIGAGGLGCEILKNLAMSGVIHVDVIDLDTIDVTNLNRQFLFRMADVGKSKAEVAAAFIRQRCPWVEITAHHGKIQSFGPDFYAGFDCVISGLDNIEARRWLNSLLCGLVRTTASEDDDDDEEDEIDPDTIVPLIDGGTEGLRGQARLILPRITSCFECTLGMFPPQTHYPLCTIAETPRRPEHCIAYASVLLWDRTFPDRKLDTDSPTDMQWIYQRALERSQQFQIPGVTYQLTLGVVKNIIPAVASTNALVAAACVHEAVKLLTCCSQSLNTYLMYAGGTGVYTHVFVPERDPECPVCSSTVLRLTDVKAASTLREFLNSLKDNQRLRLSNPSATTDTKQTLYMTAPAALRRATEPNLDKALSELITDGQRLTVTDPTLADTTTLQLTVHFATS